MNLFNQIDEDITLLLDNLPMGIVRLNSQKKSIYANKFIYNTLNITSCEEICHVLSVCMHEEDREKETKLCSDFVNNLVESESTFRLFNPHKNEYRWMTNKRTLIRPINNMNNFSFMYTLQDVHENKLMEINLRNETIKAEQAYNHKSIFLANINHELRTPLNGIIGMLTLLEDTPLSSDQQDYILMIKECSFNLMTIINDILDYSKLEVGKISLDVKTMNLQECIESTNDIVLSKIYEKSLEYNYNIQPEIPSYIKSDSNRIKQVILNLLSNSIKFTDKGTIFLNVEMITEIEYNFLHKLYSTNNELITSKKITDDFSESNSIIEIQDNEDNKNQEHVANTNFVYLRFNITDTGCGIDSSDYDKLFKSFSQIDNRLTSKIYQGTGLGLAISKELVELMDGCIWLDWSEVSKGSRFSFILKMEPTVNDLVLYDENENDLNLLKNKNVLILDDNLYNRISLAGIISKWGMKAYSFSNTEEALYFAKITKFDLGLIDVCMPKFDGPTFAAKLREQCEFYNKSFPLIALSSLGDKVSSISKYFKMHLIKPIKEHKLKHICIESLKQYIQYKNECNNECNLKCHLNCDETQIVNSNLSINSTHAIHHENNKSLDFYISENNISELKDNIRILLAEDIYINQKVITSFLNKMGFHNIQVVENGQQCVDLIHQSDFEIVLLDIRMPIMNGEVALKNILDFYKRNTLRKKPYIVAVTAYCLKEDKEKYLDIGFDNYIPKPVSYNELLICMNNFIHSLLQN